MRYNFTKFELDDLLKACSSVKKEISKSQFIWKKRAILNSDGNPIGLESFMVQSGERRFVTPVQIERNTQEEVKAAKAAYAEEMKRKYGSNWREEKKGAVVKLHSFKQLSMLLK